MSLGKWEVVVVTEVFDVQQSRLARVFVHCMCLYYKLVSSFLFVFSSEETLCVMVCLCACVYCLSGIYQCPVETFFEPSVLPTHCIWSSSRAALVCCDCVCVIWTECNNNCAKLKWSTAKFRESKEGTKNWGERRWEKRNFFLFWRQKFGSFLSTVQLLFPDIKTSTSDFISDFPSHLPHPLVSYPYPDILPVTVCTLRVWNIINMLHFYHILSLHFHLSFLKNTSSLAFLLMLSYSSFYCLSYCVFGT